MVEARIRYVCGIVTYDGTDFHGFQVQASVPTIQGTLEAALDRFCERTTRLAGAGRTDTGVHASGQVVAVKVAWRHSLEQLQNAWNVHLPPSIVVRGLTDVPAGFHPRFSAQRRTYRYYVVEDDCTTVGRSPLTDRFALYVPQPLALEAMQAATEVLVGEHDFATFGHPTQGKNTVRHVFAAEWQTVTDSLDPLAHFLPRRIVLTISANGFLRNMVRNLVGSCLAVGRGEWTVERVADALAARDRKLSAPPAPPQGLVLEQVLYPEQFDPWSSVRWNRVAVGPT